MIEFQSNNKKFGLQIKEKDCQYIYELCKMSGHFETGGLLIGRYSDDLKWAIIEEVTGPPVGSRRMRASYERNALSAKTILDSVWDKGQYYIGEWHYHPSFSANPSSRDRATMNELSRYKKLNCSEPIMMIVAHGMNHSWKEYISVFTDGVEIQLFKM